MKIICLCFMLSLAIFGCKEGGGGGGSGSIDLSVATEAPDVGLFDVWTLKATVASSSCPDVSNGKVVEEEYRVVKTDSGCQLSDETAEGSSLTNREQLFDDETTTCKVGGKVVTLTEQKQARLGSSGSGSGPAPFVEPPAEITKEDFVMEATKAAQRTGSGCSISGSAASRLELGGNGQLSGNVGYTLTLAGDCGSLKNCDVTGTVVGTRGRHARTGSGTTGGRPPEPETGADDFIGSDEPGSPSE